MFSRKSMIWQIYPQYLILILVSLIVVTLYSSEALKDLFLQRTRIDLEARGRLISQILNASLENRQFKDVNRQIHDLASLHQIRITVILPDGVVIADSEEDHRFMENHADRPEIREAYQKRTGFSIRFSYTLKLDMLYVAVPVIAGEHVIGVVRTSMAASDLSLVLTRIYRKIVWTGILVVLISGVIGFFYTYLLNKPIQRIKSGAQRIGRGELNHRIYITRPVELKNLADSMNKMADQLEERIDIITKQRNELEAILSSMVEAVLVVDVEEHVVRLNHAMSKLFNIKPEEAVGKDLQTIIRNMGLQRFIRKTLDSKHSQEAEFIIISECEFTVQAHGTLIRDASDEIIGGLIVLNDITRQKNLENIRREFVANVSHELKTPITAIQGFVETLKEGAIHDKKKAPEFLDIIIKHTDRLNLIIEDLLNLSRIERDSEKGDITLQTYSVRQLLEEAVALCRTKADENNIQIELIDPGDFKAQLNAPLMTQAIVNLLDNAVKYSSPEGRIKISADEEPSGTVIQVEDNGIGIPKADIPRIFERFYRVDKARTRLMGGSGLGLSIVKHIMLIHGGSVHVESEVGRGSLFRLSLPK
ncbi:PAS domain-containing protein [bacterium]|nr:PAS domain-containing protein [bacterium]